MWRSSCLLCRWVWICLFFSLTVTAWLDNMNNIFVEISGTFLSVLSGSVFLPQAVFMYLLQGKYLQNQVRSVVTRWINLLMADKPTLRLTKWLWVAGNYVATGYNWIDWKCAERNNQLHLPVSSGVGSCVSVCTTLTCRCCLNCLVIPGLGKNQNIVDEQFVGVQRQCCWLKIGKVAG